MCSIMRSTINVKKKGGRPVSWKPPRTNQLKRLTNKVRGRRFGHLYKRILRETIASFHPPDSNYIFWSDLTHCHYSKQALTWMDENVNIVPKENNPPNAPQERLIENCWSVWHKKFTREAGRLKRSSSWFVTLNARWKNLIQVLWRAF